MTTHILEPTHLSMSSGFLVSYGLCFCLYGEPEQVGIMYVGW